MPIRGKSRGRKRPSYRKKAKAAKPSMAIVKRYVNKQIHKNIEDKGTTVQIDNQLISDDFTTNGYDLLANMYRGTTEQLVSGNGQVNQGMLGLQVRLRYLDIRFSIFGQPQDAGFLYPTTTYSRVMIVMDNQATNNTMLRLYDNTTNFDNLILQTNHIQSPLQLNRKRYKVLYDKIVKTNSTTNNIHVGKIRVNLKNTLLQYFPTTTAFYELNKRLGFFLVATNDQEFSRNPTLQFYSRVVFEDA